MTDTEFLDNERKQIWARLVELERDIKKNTPEYESEAKQASKKCAEFRNKCEATKNEAEVHLKKVKNASDDITKSNVSLLISDIESYHAELAPKNEAINIKITKLEELFENYESYAEQLEGLEKISVSADESSVKIEAVFTQVTTRKKEVDQLYFEIFGYIETDETTGKETKVLGLKSELDIAYKTLKSDFEQFSKDKKLSLIADLLCGKSPIPILSAR